MRIAILDDYQDAFRTLTCFPRLKGNEVVCFRDTLSDPIALAKRLEGFDAVVLTQQRTSLTRATIEKLPQLRLVAQTGSRATHIDLAACSEHGIIVSCSPAGPSHATVELTWALILAASRNIVEEAISIRKGTWQVTLGDGLAGRTLGIYAFGKIGSMIAPVGRAFGMRVLCWGREGSRARALAAGYEVAESQEQFFSEADILTLHIPLNGETRGIVTAQDLGRMKPTALLVNTSRAGIIAPGALVQALETGRPGRAAVDVYESEPITDPKTEKLLSLPNVLCTPHLGYVERSNYEQLFGGVVDAILAFGAGAPVNVANPEALSSKP